MKPAETCLVNGQPGNQINIMDRGLQYGDGLFETLLISNGKPEFWQRHMKRLSQGCDRLGIDFPGLELLFKEAMTLCAGKSRGVLKIILTRGESGRGYRAEPGIQATRIISVHDSRELQSRTRARMCKTRLAINPALAGIKHLNRLEQVLARSEWEDADTMEGIMCDTDGNMVSGTMSNIFYYAQGLWHTPAVLSCGIAGVTRSVIMDLMQEQGQAVSEVTVPVSVLESAEEVFVCNSVAGIVALTQFEDTVYSGQVETDRVRSLYQQQAVREITE